MITREEIRKEYEQLTCKQVHLLSLNDGEIFTYMYVNWLEDNLLNQINKRHKQDSLHDAAMAAWMAARNRYSGVVGGEKPAEMAFEKWFNQWKEQPQ